MPYEKQTWANGAAGGTPLNATRLNYMEDGIEAAMDAAESGTSVPLESGIQYASLQAGLNAGAKIQAAHDALPAAGGIIQAQGLSGAQTISTTIAFTKPVLLLLGKSTLTSSVTPALTFTDDFAIEGMGDASVIAGSSLAGPIIRSANTATRYYDVFLSGFTIDNVSSGVAGGIGIDFTNISASTIERVNIHDVEHGIKIEAVSGGAYYNDLINCHITNTVKALRLLSGANENSVWGGRYNGTTGIEVDGTSNTHLYNPAIEGFTTGISVSPTTAATGTKMYGPRLENTPTSGTGILVAAASSGTYIVGPYFGGLTANITDNASDTIVISDSHYSRQLRTEALRLGTGASSRSLLKDDGTAILARNSGDTDYRPFYADEIRSQGANNGLFRAIRADTTTYSSFILRTGGSDKWALQQRASSSNLFLRDEANGATIFEVEPGSAPNLLPGATDRNFGSSTKQWRVFHSVIATASLPAAAAGMDGALIIEDAGAGDRNLIVYAGGQRFRIDGGAAF